MPKFWSLFFLVLFFLGKGNAQSLDTLAPGVDYSYLRLDQVLRFYEKYKLEIVQADNPDLFLEVFTWIGTPYSYGGRSHQGVDCSALASQIYAKVYGKKIGGSCRDIFPKCMPIDNSQIVEGDLVFFNTRGTLTHVGVYLGNNKFVHAAVHGGVMINDLEEAYYKRNFYKAARFTD
jgi:hypothetical protein